MSLVFGGKLMFEARTVARSATLEEHRSDVARSPVRSYRSPAPRLVSTMPLPLPSSHSHTYRRLSHLSSPADPNPNPHSYPYPSPSTDMTRVLNKTAPMRVADVGRDRMHMSADMPVFTLPALTLPPLRPPPGPQLSYSADSVLQHFNTLSAAEVVVLRRFLRFSVSEWNGVASVLEMQPDSRDGCSALRAAWSMAHRRIEGSDGPVIVSCVSIPRHTIDRPRQHKSTSTMRSRPRHGTIRSETRLRAQLLSSLTTLQSLSCQLRDGILEVPRMVDLDSSSGALAYVRRLGIDKLVHTLARALLRQCRVAWTAWRLCMDMDRQSTKILKVISLMRYRVLSTTFSQIVLKLLRRVMRIWLRTIHWETLSRKIALERVAAIHIQRVFRGYRVRLAQARRIERGDLERVYDALVLLQAFFRGRVARLRYLKLRRIWDEDRSVRLIQRVVRGGLGRQTATRRRELLMRRRGATLFQAAFRGWLVRRDCMRRQRLSVQNTSAVLMQAAARGFIARRRVHAMLRHRHHEQSVLVLQRLTRGFLARKNLHKKLAKIDAYRRERNAAAVVIQKVYRGFRARVIAYIMRREYARLKTIRDPAATKINGAARCFLARRLYKEKVRARYSRWVEQARDVKEFWSDEYNMWYYFIERTGESFWEPPKTGYTKSDGNLVLESGAVIPDPLVFADDPLQIPLMMNEHMCSECSIYTAIRACTQCGDGFCVPCYKSQHATGSRLRHQWTALGPRECSDCETSLAERYCVPCDEAFCDACWRRVHLKGKRRFHPFASVDVLGRVDERIVTIDGTEVTYDPAFAHTQFDQQQQQQQQPQEWAQYIDDNGYPYWYNSVSGASQYEDPWSAAAS